VYLVDGKSTIEHTYRDNRGLVVRVETGIWSSGAWRDTGWTKFTYDMAGRLTKRESSNGGLHAPIPAG
jgi:hypothetical protein